MDPLFLFRQPAPEAQPIKLTSVNKFISNISKIAPNRHKAYSYQEEQTQYVLWYNKDFNVVNMQVLRDFQEGSQKCKLGIQGGDKITYHFNGSIAPKGINQNQRELLRRFFSLAKQWSGYKKEGAEATIEKLKAEDHARYVEISKIFIPPKEETILNECRATYAQLSKKERDVLISKASTISVDNFTCGPKVDFVDSSWTQAHLCELSNNIFSPFKENLIFPLGQSPAWFAAMAQIDQPNPERFSHVAFSGDWYGLFDDATGKELLIEYEGRSIPRDTNDYLQIHSIGKDLNLQLIEKNKPTPEQTECYRSYLSRVGCTPARIMEQNEPAVIIDYVQRAGGLKSYLEFLFTWAEKEGISREELKRKLIVLCMYDKACGLLGDEDNATAYMQKNMGEYSSSPVIAFPVTDDEYTTTTQGIRSLFAKAHNTVSEQHRLIKRFPPSQWTEENCKKCSFAEYNGQVNEYILPIYANFMHTVGIMSGH